MPRPDLVAVAITSPRASLTSTTTRPTTTTATTYCKHLFHRRGPGSCTLARLRVDIVNPTRPGLLYARSLVDFCDCQWGPGSCTLARCAGVAVDEEWRSQRQPADHDRQLWDVLQIIAKSRLRSCCLSATTTRSVRHPCPGSPIQLIAGYFCH